MRPQSQLNIVSSASEGQKFPPGQQLILYITEMSLILKQ